MNKPVYYTGIGSRSTPASVQHTMKYFGALLYSKGYTLRSGAADGADFSFESGSVFHSNTRSIQRNEIYIPWENFPNIEYKESNYINFKLSKYKEEALRLLESVSPFLKKESHKLLHGRNMMQVLGEDLKTPSSFLVCWTPGARLVGGTATAIKLAMRYKIPVYNLSDDLAQKDLEKFLINT